MKEQYRIAAKRSLTPEIGQISVEAPLIAAKAKAGQFIILRVDEAGERIPLTISSAQDGKVTVVYQKVGGTTLALDLYICTDDGSYGYHGFVTGKLEELIQGGAQYDHVVAIGPLMMMKFACKLTEKYHIPTTVSMNPIMIDGTGMCGCCRVTVGGEVKFACVDGPDFDGHQVDFDEVIARNATYREFEARRKQDHLCRLGGGAMNG